METKDEEITISVHNEDSYIPPEERALIFERYYRGVSTEHKASGTGIGLSAALHAVQAMAGRIHLQSSADDGTTFRVVLPAVAQEG